MQTDNTVY